MAFFVHRSGVPLRYTCCMVADAALNDFLRNPSWERGTPLLAQYKSELDNTDVMIIETSCNSYTLDLLVDVLTPISKKQTLPVLPKSIAPETSRAAPTTRGYKTVYQLPNAAQLPADLQDLREQCLVNLRRQNELRGQLKVLAYPEGRKAGKQAEKLYDVATMIITLEADLQAAYTRIDYFITNDSYMPGTAPLTGLARIKYLASKAITHHNYISKNKRSNDPHRIKEVRIREAELNEFKVWYNG